MTLPNLAIVAGTGALPKQLAEHCKSINRPYHIVQFQGIDLDWLTDDHIITARYEKPNALFKALKARDCTQIVFAGAMQRPKLTPLKFDVKLMKLAPTLLPALKSGDDGTLRMIASIFESEGFEILAAHDILDSLMVSAGTLTQASPSAQDQSDIDRGFAILNTLSNADIGQACVVGQGLCLGVETIQGSDALLSFVGNTKAPFLVNDTAQGVFVKAPKTNQDNRMDMPTIGPNTIQSVADAGLSGIAIQAGRVQILDQETCVDLANTLGLFIVAQGETT